MPYKTVSMLSADRFYAVLGCFRIFFEMNWICLCPLVSIDKYRNKYSQKYSPLHMGELKNLPTESFDPV